MLERGGYAPYCVDCGTDALRALESGNFFAVLVDMLMPDMDGLELLRIVKRRHPDVSVIAMTGASGPLDYLGIALKLGADDVMKKPFRPMQLIEVVAKQQCIRQIQRSDERQFVRVPVSFDGQILEPHSSIAHPCKVLNISAGGVLIASDAELSRDGAKILFIDNFGRFEVRIAHHQGQNYGLEFAMGELKRKRLMDLVAIYLANGSDGVANMRQSPRDRVHADIQAVRPDGERITCSVIDISLDGASLKANTKPPIGEIVSVGKTQGRIVRHHKEGFAIQFVAPAESGMQTMSLLTNSAQRMGK